jgi:hypothetical protein
MGIPYEPPAKDLTPGDFHVMDGQVEVDTDSLLDFSQSLFKNVLAFEVNAAGPLAFMTADAKQGWGEGSLGKDEAFSEARWLALRASLSAGESETLTTDLVFGNKALSEVAMVMSEQYGGTDGFNAVRTANAVNDAFNPPPGAQNTLGVDRAAADAARAERDRRRNLPVVDPSDVHLYNMSGLREGEDYIIASDQNPLVRDEGAPPIGDDPTTEATESPNEFYTVPTDMEEPPDQYVPPEPEDADDGNALRFDEHGNPMPTLNDQRDRDNG